MSGRHWLIALAMLATPALAEPRFTIIPGTQVETVFRWTTQRCMEMHVPDSPARALRTSDGGVALFAAHLVNIPMLGRDFESLSPVCGAVSRGAESADPAEFQDRFWVQALVPFTSGGRRQVLGLASHEYMGWRHADRCLVPFEGAARRPAAFRCWYSAITAVVASEGDWRFTPVPGRAGVIAASPLPYDPTTPARTGFFSVSNAMVEDGHATVLVYTEGIAGQRRGNCLLRAPLDKLPGGWRALSRGTFDLELPGAYAGGADPARAGDVVGDNVFGGAPVRGWLSPWISESRHTPDLLAETGYRYTLNWCHDDQPLPMRTRSGQPLWAIPYPQELNDIPMIVGRQMEGRDFARMIVDNTDEMLQQSRSQPLVMGVALHPYLVGQPYRLRHLRTALQHLCAARDRGEIWFTTPGAICEHVERLAQDQPGAFD